MVPRIIGIVPNQDQVGGLIDSLEAAGFDRRDMIVSNLSKSLEERRNPSEITFLKTEREGLWETGAYIDFLADEAGTGIVVAVEVPRHEAARVREIMEQNGAAKILQD
ncbi:hypothetical protein TAMC210_04290 [Thermanaeromonas sp. C210]|nr:hypothetical protein TAMC210_04290 [Thermanaeromonas sp. C210]